MFVLSLIRPGCEVEIIKADCSWARTAALKAAFHLVAQHREPAWESRQFADRLLSDYTRAGDGESAELTYERLGFAYRIDHASALPSA